MNHSPDTLHPPVGLGMLSLVLGTVGLLVCFMPVLGIPLSGLGLLIGSVGCAIALAGGSTSLRWAVAGVSLCALAASINLAIAYAPSGYVQHRTAPPRMWQPVPGVPYVPPPALPLDR